MSNSNTELIEDVYVKLHSPNNKTTSAVCIYLVYSHEVQARYLSGVEKITNAFSSIEMIFFVWCYQYLLYEAR